MADKTCPKCKGGMVSGSFTGNTTNWAQKSDRPFLSQSGQRITTYACDSCGYMESYVKK